MELLIKLFTEKEDIPIVLYCVNGTGTVFTIYGIGITVTLVALCFEVFTINC